MKTLKYFIINAIETMLRMVPFPTKTGVIKIGNPDRNSPVLLTCNFHLTVERVKRALQGMDCYLLVAKSKGINVWCAATGGLFTHHDVISVLKTSGIDELVDHRKVILPQLAATGIEGKIVRERSGWHVIWGPVYAKDIRAFIRNKFKKDVQMRVVRFPFVQRMEMAIAWAFPISVIAALIILPFWRHLILALSALIWGMSFFIFLAIPLFENRLRASGKRIGFIVFDFGRGGIQLALWGFFLLLIFGYAAAFHETDINFMLRWSFITLVITLLLSMDLMGSTPVFKSSLHEDRLLKISIDHSKCKTAGFCELVCPRNCYEINRHAHKTSIPRADDCVRCGACIVQCPYDALFFKNSDGEILPPEKIRKYKLNLSGKHLVKVG